MDNAIWIAIIVAIPTVLATTLVPLLMKRADNAIRTRERAEDREALQEAAAKTAAVADQARVAAQLLAENTIKAASAAQKLAEKVDKVAEVQDVVHTLVNSKLTVTTQKLRDRTATALELTRAHEPAKLVEIKLLMGELGDLDAELADRAGQAKLIERESQHPRLSGG